MVKEGIKQCPICNGELKHYSKARRKIQYEFRQSEMISINILKCEKCGKYHRELPNYLDKFGHYKKRNNKRFCGGFSVCHGFEIRGPSE